MLDQNLWQTFPSLSRLTPHGGRPARQLEFVNAFTLRHPDIDVQVDREDALTRLWAWHQEIAAELGFSPSRLVTAQQVHGREVAVINEAHTDAVPAVDGLISNTPNILLGIYVADCCAVYLTDPVSGAFGIVHSGKKGTDLGITQIAIEKMQCEFGTRTENLIVQLSPCIRPPAYEVDFAAAIREQARASGVLPQHIHDDGTCTAREPAKYYSYRMEKGKTGRMLALLGKRTA